jgi:DNA-directed RNA polymerase III subunit RPC1
VGLALWHMSGHRGFSIGIEDVTPSPALLELKQGLLSEGYGTYQSTIDMYKAGKIPLKAGCDLKQSLESDLNGQLQEVRPSTE